MVQWMRNRRPRYKGAVMLEAERPSPSYIVDVGHQYTEIYSVSVHLSDAFVHS